VSEPEGRGAASEGGWEGGRGARNERRGKAVPVKGEGEAGGAPEVSNGHGTDGRMRVAQPAAASAGAMTRGGNA